MRGTKKFLDRAGKVDAADERPSTTVLGNWYATVCSGGRRWLFVNESTLLPVVIPMAPAATIVQRFVAGMPETFGDYGLDPRFVEAEVEQMAAHRLDKTICRSVLGVMNEFKLMADNYLRQADDVELQELALWLAQTPCGPLYTRQVSPDRELRAVAAEHMP